MIFIDVDLVNDQVQILRIELVLLQNLIKDLNGGLGGSIDPNDRIFAIFGQFYLFFQAGNSIFDIRLHLVVGSVDDGFVLRTLQKIAHTLPFCDLKLLLELFENRFHVVSSGLFLGQIFILLLNVIL